MTLLNQELRMLDDAELDAVNGGIKIEPVYGPQSLKINTSPFSINPVLDVAWATYGAPTA
jgi:hypothetical protein